METWCAREDSTKKQENTEYQTLQSLYLKVWVGRAFIWDTMPRAALLLIIAWTLLIYAAQLIVSLTPFLVLCTYDIFIAPHSIHTRYGRICTCHHGIWNWSQQDTYGSIRQSSPFEYTRRGIVIPRYCGSYFQTNLLEVGKPDGKRNQVFLGC